MLTPTDPEVLRVLKGYWDCCDPAAILDAARRRSQADWVMHLRRRAVAVLSLKGYTPSQIARVIHRHPASVRRLLEGRKDV